VIKVTLTLDDDTVARLRRAASRSRKPQSQIVREAVREYAARLDQLSEEERSRLLEAFDRLVPGIPAKPAGEVDAELREIRAARRRWARPRRRADRS